MIYYDDGKSCALTGSRIRNYPRCDCTFCAGTIANCCPFNGHSKPSESYYDGCGCSTCVDYDWMVHGPGDKGKMWDLPTYRTNRVAIFERGFIGHSVAKAPVCPPCAWCKVCNYKNEYIGPEYLSADGTYTCRSCRNM